MPRRLPLVLLFTVCLFFNANTYGFTASQAHGVHGEESLGTVHFPTSCSAEVQPQFNRAIALLHSFWFQAAIDAFEEVLEVDSSCGISYWGIALATWGNPIGSGANQNGSRPTAQLQAGLDAIQQARATGVNSERERDYIEALANLYDDYAEKVDWPRVLDYEKAMEALATKYPEDSEAAIFYALAIVNATDPNDKSYAKPLRAAAILEPAFIKEPDHPGVAHYIIHGFDVPSLANRALDAAERYAAIAPLAPHALHMPSHTFTRLGYWQNSIDTNIKSAAAALEDKSPAEALHAMDYMIYGYLQTGQDVAAGQVVEDMKQILATMDSPNSSGLGGSYAIAAIEARHALERKDWTRAAALNVRRTPVPFVDAITYFARALGAARNNMTDQARSDLEQLKRASDSLGGTSYWGAKVDIQRQVAEAWILFAEGQANDALALMRLAADREDQTEKSGISPGPIAPARELLGEMLLEAGRRDAALEAFETTTKEEPGRFRGLYGAARAAQLAGNGSLAEQYYSTLLEVAARADADGRPELSQARTFLASN